MLPIHKSSSFKIRVIQFIKLQLPCQLKGFTLLGSSEKTREYRSDMGAVSACPGFSRGCRRMSPCPALKRTSADFPDKNRDFPASAEAGVGRPKGPVTGHSPDERCAFTEGTWGQFPRVPALAGDAGGCPRVPLRGRRVLISRMITFLPPTWLASPELWDRRLHPPSVSGRDVGERPRCPGALPNN